MSEDNEIFVVDRLKVHRELLSPISRPILNILDQELLKVKGFQVAPAELEGCLLSHPDIVDCCVVGIPDDYNGELPLAYVVLSSDAHERLAFSPEAEYDIKCSIIKVSSVAFTIPILAQHDLDL